MDIVAGHLQRGSAIRWREDIEMDVAKISGGAVCVRFNPSWQGDFQAKRLHLQALVQGWKLQAVPLSGTGKNRAGQVKILDNFPKERLKLWKLLSVCLSRTGNSRAGQVYFFNTFRKERLKHFVISIPDLWARSRRVNARAFSLRRVPTDFPSKKYRIRGHFCKKL